MNQAAMAPARRAVNLAQLLMQAARRLGDHDALVTATTRWSWRQLDERVSALAADLAAAGVRSGDCVLVHSHNHLELVQAMFACWRLGAVVTPTNARLLPADIAELARICQPVAMLCHAELAEHEHAVRALGTLTAGTWWIAADGPGSVAGVPPAPEPVPNSTVWPGDACWYFFTSGTSGSPKAAVLTHDQLGFVITNHLCDLMPGTTEHDVSLAVAPLSHGAGIHLLSQVARGVCTVLTDSPGLDPDEVWRSVATERVTNLFTVPTILKLLTESPAVDAHDHSSLRYVIYAGAPMYAADAERARAALGEVLVQYYGLAEVTGNITVLPPDQHGRPQPSGAPFGTCGYERTGMQVSIQDDGGRELPAGEQGEICVAGPAVFAGYLDNPAANAESFRDGWFRTGDLGFVDADGYVYVTGRASDMYISGGSNIHPREIEEKLLAHPDLTEVAVVGMPDEKWGEVGVAVCVARPESQLHISGDTSTIPDWLAGSLARYKLPKHFVLWDELPKSGYGKIAKRTIQQRLREDGWEAHR